MSIKNRGGQIIKNDDYGTEGMCLGITFGMLIGLTIGTFVKKEEDNDKSTKNR